MKSRISAAAAAAAVLLTACSDSEPPAVDRVEAQAVDVTIVSPAPDNLTGAATTNIAATVFVPAHAPGETYPLILHSHGWGGDRITAVRPSQARPPMTDCSCAGAVTAAAAVPGPGFGCRCVTAQAATMAASRKPAATSRSAGVPIGSTSRCVRSRRKRRLRRASTPCA